MKYIDKILNIKISMDKILTIFIILASVTAAFLLLYWLISDYLKGKNLVNRILSIIQQDRYYEGGVIDSQIVNSDIEKVVTELKKEINKPENEIRKMIDKYFNYSRGDI